MAAISETKMNEAIGAMSILKISNVGKEAGPTAPPAKVGGILNQWTAMNKTVMVNVGCRSITAFEQNAPKGATHCRYECSGEDKVKKRPDPRSTCWSVAIVAPVITTDRGTSVGPAMFTTLIPSTLYRVRTQWSSDNQATWSEWSKVAEAVTLSDPWIKFNEADYTLDQKFEMIRNVIKLPKSVCSESSRRLFGKDWILLLDEPLSTYLTSFNGEATVAGKHVRRYDPTHIAELCRAIFNLGRHGNQPSTPAVVKETLFKSAAYTCEHEHFDGRSHTLKYFSSKIPNFVYEIWSIEKFMHQSQTGQYGHSNGQGGDMSMGMTNGDGVEGAVVQIEVQVVPYAAGLVIGKGGETIKDIQRMTNTRIVSPLPEVPMKIFLVTGQADNVEAARWHIKAKEKAWLVTQLNPCPTVQLIYWHPMFINMYHQGTQLPYGTFRLERNLHDGTGVFVVADPYGEVILQVGISEPIIPDIHDREQVMFQITQDNVPHYFNLVDGQHDPKVRIQTAEFLYHLLINFRVEGDVHDAI